jgi:hypothetical protein
MLLVEAVAAAVGSIRMKYLASHARCQACVVIAALTSGNYRHVATKWGRISGQLRSAWPSARLLPYEAGMKRYSPVVQHTMQIPSLWVLPSACLSLAAPSCKSCSCWHGRQPSFSTCDADTCMLISFRQLIIFCGSSSIIIIIVVVVVD